MTRGLHFDERAECAVCFEINTPCWFITEVTDAEIVIVDSNRLMPLVAVSLAGQHIQILHFYKFYTVLELFTLFSYRTHCDHQERKTVTCAFTQVKI